MAEGKWKIKVYCPYCGTRHVATRREEMYIYTNGYCVNMCMACRQLYFFNARGAWKEKDKETENE